MPLKNDLEEEDIASYARYFEYAPPSGIKLLLARKRAAPRRTNDGYTTIRSIRGRDDDDERERKREKQKRCR